MFSYLFMENIFIYLSVCVDNVHFVDEHGKA